MYLLNLESNHFTFKTLNQISAKVNLYVCHFLGYSTMVLQRKQDSGSQRFLRAFLRWTHTAFFQHLLLHKEIINLLFQGREACGPVELPLLQQIYFWGLSSGEMSFYIPGGWGREHRALPFSSSTA